MNILVTGSEGFIAKNLITHLSNNPEYNILTINKRITCAICSGLVAKDISSAKERT